MKDACLTRYPLLLVHGTGFRDGKRLGYWGRIPAALEAHGARVFYGHQDSWATVEHNAAVIARRIDEIREETGCDKVNIVAHSKGGLEARYVASSLSYAERIASITTISTPHRGSRTMDKLLRLPAWVFRILAVLVNGWCRLMGDSKPDFCAVSRSFSTAHMEAFNRDNPDAPGVYYQSYASVMSRLSSDLILWLPYLVIRCVEGENDGLVTPESAAWTGFRGVWRSPVRRGLSHLDAVDGRRRSVKGDRDIRERYIDIVEELKNMGF